MDSGEIESLVHRRGERERERESEFCNKIFWKNNSSKLVRKY